MHSYVDKIFYSCKKCVLHAVPKEIVEEEDPVENVPHELDDLADLDDLDEDPNEGCSDVEEWVLQDGSNDRD
jgi:hypothetical protein